MPSPRRYCRRSSITRRAPTSRGVGANRRVHARSADIHIRVDGFLPSALGVGSRNEASIELRRAAPMLTGQRKRLLSREIILEQIPPKYAGSSEFTVTHRPRSSRRPCCAIRGIDHTRLTFDSGHIVRGRARARDAPATRRPRRSAHRDRCGAPRGHPAPRECRQATFLAGMRNGRQPACLARANTSRNFVGGVRTPRNRGRSPRSRPDEAKPPRACSSRRTHSNDAARRYQPKCHSPPVF